ncbi:MAG TPA: hypothetical protein DD636_03105 [Anaerolineaceae bacterium]|jgi:hypothetical protein|nr:hypothetical protein [Anaerolineaceae bacterium]
MLNKPGQLKHLVPADQRPITIRDISISLLTNGFWEQVPRSNMFSPEGWDENFHLKIGSHDSITLYFDAVLSDGIMESHSNVVRIIVYTIDGNKFSHFSTRLANVKWGSIEKLK